MIRKLSIPFLMLFMAAATWAEGALSFTRTEQTIIAKPDEESVTFTFPFKNSSDKPVRLESLKANCECTEAGFEGNKKVLASGESSSVVATMKIGMFSGTDAKKLTVTADGKEYELALRITVPEIVQLSTRQLDWEQGSPAIPKTITVTINPDSGVKLTEFSLAGQDFTYEPVTVKKGEKYKIIITPTSTSKPLCNTFWILTDSKIPRYSRYIGMLTVTPPPSRDK